VNNIELILLLCLKDLIKNASITVDMSNERPKLMMHIQFNVTTMMKNRDMFLEKISNLMNEKRKGVFTPKCDRNIFLSEDNILMLKRGFEE